MKQPPGFRNPEHPDYVCCLTKAIYGLKQAPRAWYSAFKHALTEFGFINSKSDSSLFVFHTGSTLAYCLVYVDDLIITGNNSVFVASIVDHLGQKFSIKDLGSLHFFSWCGGYPYCSRLVSHTTQVYQRFTCQDQYGRC